MPIDTPYMQQSALGQMDAAQIAGPATSAGTTTTEQLQGVLNTGGPLMQQAANVGNSQAAARGLLNSSMGIQAAQNAVVQNAAQLAQANASNINQNNQFNASNEQQVNMQNAANQQAAGQFNTQQENAMNTWNAGQQNDATLKTMDMNSREQLANIEANYKTLMQTNASASGMYEQMLKNLSDISASKDMDAAAKTAAMNNQLTYLSSGMQMLQNMNGITNLVTF